MVSAVVPAPVPGVIEPSVLYRFEIACRLMGWGKAAARAARRKGLRVLYSGKNAYVRGSEVIRYVEETADSEH